MILHVLISQSPRAYASLCRLLSGQVVGASGVGRAPNCWYVVCRWMSLSPERGDWPSIPLGMVQSRSLALVDCAVGFVAKALVQGKSAKVARQLQASLFLKTRLRVDFVSGAMRWASAL